jgi:uncharacterized protein (DUF58 family)
MSPSLTSPGKWVLASGLIFLLVGAALSDPLILLLGQIHVVLLVFAVLAVVPSALVLDRRLVALELESDGGTRSGTGHVVGEKELIRLKISNPSHVALNHFQVKPYLSAGIEASTPEGVVAIGGGRQIDREFYVTGLRSGRWVLHGFDVSVHDPFGMVETRDYLPAMHAFEFYPFAGWIRRNRKSPRIHAPQSKVGAHAVQSRGSGTEMRELRDWHSGDTLRDIAWKPSVRARRLVSREFEREVTTTSYVVLDVSSSMRGGQKKGEILEYAVHLAVELVDNVIRGNDRVGFMTFDEKLYGHILPASSTRQMQKVLHHLVGLSTVVDPELTELDDADLYKLAADYALVQERLDFRKGEGVDSESGVNTALLERWIATMIQPTRRAFDSPVLHEGVLNRKTKLVREFLQLRGVEVPYRVEARLGMKERGLVQAIEEITKTRPMVQSVTIISDLCGVMNIDPVIRAMRTLRHKKAHLSFIVPFGPSFYDESEDMDERYDVARGLFTSAEADERAKAVNKLRGHGVEVSVIRPSSRMLAQPAGVD